MAKTVFYSFHYDNDAWRVQQVMQMGALEGQPLLNSQEWEQIRRKGDPAIEKWISDQMSYKSAVVVLVGSGTASRPWVKYEITKAWNERKPLVGIRIHGLANSAGATESPGGNPFARVGLQNGKTVADYVRLHDPVGTTSKEVHASIAANMSTWVDSAYKRT
jgi:hypothetical protein